MRMTRKSGLEISALGLFVFLLGGAMGCAAAKPVRPVEAPRTGEVAVAPSEIPSNPARRPYVEVEGVTEYVIWPGDVLDIISFRGARQEILSATVRPDGKISYPLAGDLSVAGLTPSQAQNLLVSRLSKFLKQPAVEVVVKEYNSKKVNLLGEINTLNRPEISGPSTYPLKGKTTLLGLILRAGGYTNKADLGRIELTRQGRVYKVNLYKVAFEGGGEDLILEDGDQVNVPQLDRFVERKVFVLGAVNRPGVVEYKGTISALEAVSKAEGLNLATAAAKRSVLIRKGVEEPIPLNIDALTRKGDLRQNLELGEGDAIFVPETRLGEVSRYMALIRPILDALLFPGIYRDLYTTGGTWGRINVGGQPGATIITSPSGAPAGAATGGSQ